MSPFLELYAKSAHFLKFPRIRVILRTQKQKLQLTLVTLQPSQRLIPLSTSEIKFTTINLTPKSTKNQDLKIISKTWLNTYQLDMELKILAELTAIYLM